MIRSICRDPSAVYKKGGDAFFGQKHIEDAFAGAVFCQSSFLLAKLPGAPMRGAILRECDLREARLTGADLRDADLGGSNLDGTDLQHADLTGADTSGVDFSHGPKFYQTKRADRYPDKEFLGILTDVFEQFLREKDVRLPESPDTGPVLPDSVRTRLQKEIVRQAFTICASSRTGWCVPYKGGVNQKAILFLTRIADVLDSYLQGAGASIPSSEKEKKERNQENAPAVIFGSDMVSFIGMLAAVCQSACCSNGYLPVWRDAEGRLVTKS